METKTLIENTGSEQSGAALDVDQMRENKSVAARIKRQLNYSLLGLTTLAVILGSLVVFVFPIVFLTNGYTTPDRYHPD